MTNILLKNNNTKIISAILFCAVITISCAADSFAATERYNRRKLVVQDHIKAGKVYYDIKMYEKAAEQWAKALEIDPYDRKTAALLESAKKKLDIEARAAVIKKEIVKEKPLKEILPKKLPKEIPQEKLPKEIVAEKPKKEIIKEKPSKEIAPEKPKKEIVQEKPPKEIAPEIPVEEIIAEKKPAIEVRQEFVPDASQAGLGQPVVVDGDRVEYFHEKKEVVGEGNISIKYKDVVLTCDKITVYVDSRDAVAEGNVKITQADAYFTGNTIKYNFDTRQASVKDGYINAVPFYGRAQELDKTANKDEFKVERGYVTTCDRAKPHYRVQSRQILIYPEDKIIAKHIVVFIGNVPIFYLPYYVQPLNDTKSHITVMPGKSSEWGYYNLASYRYHLDDKNQGDILLDYRSKKGLAEGINHYYDFGAIGNGAFKYYYTCENDRFVYDKSGKSNMNRYRWQVRHKWDLGEGTDTTAIMELNIMHDRNVVKDYFYNEYEELTANPEDYNYISIITQKRDYTSELLFRKRFNNFYTVVERLPEYRIDIPSYRLLESMPLYYTGHASAAYLNMTFDNSNAPLNNDQKDLNTGRIDFYNRLSYATRLLGAVNTTPYGGIRNTYYSMNKWGTRDQIRTIFNAGVDNSIKFYRIFNINSNFLGLDINKLRHVVTPMANYYFTHQPTVSPGVLNQFDWVDALDTDNGFLLSLENRLQTKRMSGGQMKSVDLATFIIKTDYGFRLRKDNINMKSQCFETVDLDLELRPYNWMYMQIKESFNTKHAYVQQESIDLVAHSPDDDLWSFAVGQRYEHEVGGKVNLLTYEGMYNIKDNWRFRAYQRVNVLNLSAQETEFTIEKTLHCWLVNLTYDIRGWNDQGLWLVLRLKAFPNYPIGMQRTYSRPRFGAAPSWR